MAYLPTQQWQVPVTPAKTINAVATNSSQLAVTADLAPLRVIYGQVLVSTQIANILRPDKYFYYLQGVVGEGEIEQIILKGNSLGDGLPTGVTSTTYVGASSQAVDPWLAAGFAYNGVAFSDTYPDVAYFVAKIPLTLGMVDIYTVARGRKVYDPRTGLTTYSDNPALCLADFASNPRFGLGLSVDWASVTAVAYACDEPLWVPTPTYSNPSAGYNEPRRRLSLCIDNPASADQWLETLATYAGCWAMIEGDTLTLIPDRPKAVTRTFDHAGGEILSLKNLKIRSSANTPTVVDIRHAKDFMWRSNSAKAYAAGVQAGTTPFRESQVSMPGIRTRSQAMREAIERLNKFTLTDLSCTLEVFDEALALQPGDVVQVTHPLGGLVDKKFRVQQINSDLGRHTLDLLEYNEAVYSDHVEAESTYPDTSMPNPLEPPAAVTALAADEEIYQSKDGTVGSRFRITWACDDPWEVRYAVVIYRMDDAGGSNTIQVASATPDDTIYVHGPLEDNYWYRIQVVVTRLHWSLTSTATTLDIQSLGKLLPPSNVTGLTSAVTPSGVVMNWDAVIDVDMAGYRVREGATLKATATTTSVNLGYVPIGAYTYGVKAYDRSGNESATAASISVTVNAIGAVTGLAASAATGSVVLKWLAAPSDFPLAHYEIRFGETTWEDATYAGKVSATTFSTAAAYTGTRTWRVKAVDVAGNTGSEATIGLAIGIPAAPSSFTAQFVGVDVQLNWTTATSDLPIKHYEIRHGSTWAGGTLAARVSTTTVRLPVSWSSRQFWIAAIDTDGNAGDASKTATATVVVPGQANTFGATLVQSGAQLDWTAPVTGSLAIAYYEIRHGDICATGEVISRVSALTLTVPVSWTGSRTLWVTPVDPLGNAGTERSTALAVTVPGAVTPAATAIAGKISLSWAAASSSLPLKHYEIRYGASWAAGTLVATVNATDYRVPITWTGDRTFWVAAIDSNNNAGTAGSAVGTVAVPVAPTIAASLSLDTLTLTWTVPTATLPIKDYEIKYGTDFASGTSLGKVLGTTLSLPVSWLGSRSIFVAATDINGNVGSAGSVSYTVAAPSAPSITSQVIDNNVLLYWSGSTGTLPIKTYELRKGSTWAGGTLIGQKSGGFTTVLETAAGTYQYWVAAIDTANNVGTPASYSASVAQPPDYVLNVVWQSAFGGTKSNMVTDSDGSRIMGANATETYQAHFTNNAWATPQAQASAGYTKFIEPTNSPSYYEETFDYGTTLAATKITVTQNGANVAASPVLTCRISTSLNGTTWADYDVWSLYGTNFRYVKVRITCTGGQYDLSQLTVTLDSKIRNDAGTVSCVAGDAGGTTVNFTVPFVDIAAITVTPLGTTPVTAIYDFTDTPNPTSFKVLLFNSAGSRVSGTASWAARGY